MVDCHTSASPEQSEGAQHALGLSVVWAILKILFAMPLFVDLRHLLSCQVLEPRRRYGSSGQQEWVPVTS